MKIIEYKLFNILNCGTENEPDYRPLFYAIKTMPWSEANEEIAKKEAYNGEYTIEDDGRPEPTAEPTADDVLNALLGVK